MMEKNASRIAWKVKRVWKLCDQYGMKHTQEENDVVLNEIFELINEDLSSTFMMRLAFLHLLHRKKKHSEKIKKVLYQLIIQTKHIED